MMRTAGYSMALSDARDLAEPGLSRLPHFGAQYANLLLSSLPLPDAGLLMQRLERVHLRRQQILYEADDPIDYIYFPETAIIGRAVAFEDGGSVVTTLTGPESACGLGVVLDRPHALASAIVLISGAAARVSTANFRAACADSAALQQAAKRCNTLLISQALQSTACNAYHSLERRISRWLLECADRAGGEVHLTQEMLAQMLGAQRSSVSVVASGLQASGAIKYSRGIIRVADRLMLQASACGCYRTVRRRADRIMRGPAPGYS
jgi:CRP-like cAMP-binding protein